MKRWKTTIIIVSAILVLGLITAGFFVLTANSNERRLAEQLELGQKYLEELDYEQAIVAYKAAIEIDPKCEEAYLVLAEIYVAMEDYESANDILNQGVEQTGLEEMEAYLRRLEEAGEEISEASGEAKAGRMEVSDTDEYVEAGQEKGKINSALTYEIRTEVIEFKTSKDILYFSNTVEYPYFFGTTQAELKINQRYEQMIADFRNNNMDVDAQYQNDLEWGAGLFPYYADIEADVIYNKNGAVSIKEISTMWFGGMHPYQQDYGVTFEIKTGEELAYNDILVGSVQQVDKVLHHALSSALGGVINDNMLMALKGSGYSLCDLGLCFYYNVGDAVPGIEVIIPFTDENSYVINAGNIYIETSQATTQSGGLKEETCYWEEIWHEIASGQKRIYCMYFSYFSDDDHTLSL